MADEITTEARPQEIRPPSSPPLPETDEDRRRRPRGNNLTHQVQQLRQQLEEHQVTLQQIKSALGAAAAALNTSAEFQSAGMFGYHEQSERPQRNGGGYGYNNNNSHGRNPRGAQHPRRPYGRPGE